MTKQMQFEKDLQEKYGNSKNRVIISLLAARREYLQNFGRYFTYEEVKDLGLTQLEGANNADSTNRL